jgi:hypothetical protein
MESQQYEVIVPPVSWRMYWPEGILLLLSVITPVVAWAGWRDGGIISRSGSITVFFAAVAEFVTLHRANRKHILNACRVKKGETPWDFSCPATVVGILSLFAALFGTILWGFGDLIVRK